MRHNVRAIRLRVGTNVKQLRKRHGWSQEQLAERAGKDTKSVGQVERGQANATLEVMIAIAGALDVGVGELFSTRSPEHRISLTERDYELADEFMKRFRSARQSSRRREQSS
jgi:transcriptional regulator with XRE-family HTH domain